MGSIKYVYNFGGGKADANAEMKNLLGGKGANLGEMSSLGIPVPSGFTISTEVCTYYYDHGHSYPTELEEQVNASIKYIEKVMGAKFGDVSNPLLLSIRSGARVSMPGMMDTVLNLGLNDEVAKGMAEKTGNLRFVRDSYRRFIQMYSGVVMEVKSELFEKIIDEIKETRGVKLDTELDAEDLMTLIKRFKDVVKAETGTEFPTDPKQQLWGAVGAVFRSWNTPRAIEYRRLHGYPHHWGTAVNVQSMVFGNMGEDCATGVAFTRDPSTGDNRFFGEYLINAQGEDVVAGTRTPQPINIVAKKDASQVSLEEVMPDIYKQLEKIYQKLEAHYRDMQDIEFTIQNHKLWMLQTRNGKRTAKAAVKIAVEMTKEGLISKEEAIKRVDPLALDQLLHPTFDPKAKREVVAKGLPASPGAAVGKAIFTAEDAAEWSEKGEKVILVRLETSPDDIKGMAVAQGILTARGGMTSHAAVVARGMGKPCIAGCGDINVNYADKKFAIGDLIVKEGDYISLDGTTGELMVGELPTVSPELSGEFGEFISWADEFRTMKVRTNADTPHDCEVAKKFGAEGVGLCRTEHMFFEGERIAAVREMILSEDIEGRKQALNKILSMQKGDFKAIFEVMEGLPVNIRLLDPPLHEFLPHTDKEIEALSKTMDVSIEKLKAKIEELHEFNPMLGHRGCRLGVTYPEVYAMQVQAIMEAACELKQDGKNAIPEIEIPLVGHVNELKMLKAVCKKVCHEVFKKTGVEVDYTIGTMIELPRAALTANEIAKEAEFFSFGTNDLTQTTFGFSRDDAGKFLVEYKEKGILPFDPFVTIDRDGVGQLMKIAVKKGKEVNPDMEIGICGEHGGDPSSVEFCHEIGLDYVSCSPYRVPIARLAAAQAAVKEKKH